MLAARMLAEQGWQDVRVCNVSSRGMMLRSASPPQRGAYVEIRHHQICTVGRVVWSKGTAFGINSQQKIEVRELLSGTSPVRPPINGERRAKPRANSSIQMRVLPPEEASRIVGRGLEWTAIALAVVAASVALSGVVRASLEAPFTEARVALKSAH
ncbi:hypothetical protein GRI48_14110 [Altererythrobacter oceanensis]|uniref:PilZ domain-containing protein n=2 Tax=Qipengyuania oceanensis TaxID=1463597 RepID=A0A844YMJ5_9SPHN|nr:hypothetical protein [Qipengyuania oceanensis]